ncbi:MAG: WhiB family transcriptional regulator [Streptosporangiaceae bacterium]|nr:WhiB family transcriptional regulator [Streptosporangiaceae bacterium]
MSVMTSRTITPTAPRRRPAGTRWEDEASCRAAGVNNSVFFTDTVRAHAAAKRLCRSCPVLTTCLKTAERDEAGTKDVFWLVGGLTDGQRLALRYARLLGQHPNLKQARTLLGPRWRSEIARMRTAAATPTEMVQQLRAKGALVNEATVRLAVWWSGGTGGLLSRRRPGDRRTEWQRIQDDHRDLVLALRAAGASHLDVAAYFGVAFRQANLAVTAIEKAATAA